MNIKTQTIRCDYHNSNGGYYTIATIDGTFVGLVSFAILVDWKLDGKWFWIKELFVDPVHRKKGVGEKLVEIALHYSNISFLKDKVALWCSEGSPAEKFWVKQGFTKTEKDYVGQPIWIRK